MSQSLIDCIIELCMRKQYHYFWYSNAWKESVLEKSEQFLPLSHAVYQWRSQDMHNISQHSASWTGFSLFLSGDNYNGNEDNHCSCLHHAWKLVKDIHTHVLTSSWEPYEKESWSLMICPVRHWENVHCDSGELFCGPRPTFLPTCHSCSLLRFGEFFGATKLYILISFHFKTLMMLLFCIFIFSDMWYFWAKEILIQSFGPLFNIWELMALLGVCAPWSMTA